KLFAERPFVEGELDVEGGRQRCLDLGENFVGETLGLQGGNIDRGCVGERAMADRVGLDFRNLRLPVTERAQGLWHGAVDDLEVAAAGKLLEFHQRKIRLDAGGGR